MVNGIKLVLVIVVLIMKGGGGSNSNIDELKVKEIVIDTVSESLEIGSVTTSDSPSMSVNKSENNKIQLNIAFPTYGIIEAGRDYSLDTLGAALLPEGEEGNLWVRCNSKGEPVELIDNYFNEHPIYSKIETQTIDEQEMVRIPKFYVKQEILTSGTFKGRTAWFISPMPRTGFHLHPAFKYNGKELDQFWFGAYLCTITSDNKMCSIPGNISYAWGTNGNFALEPLEQFANNRNVDGVTGFQLNDVYQINAIRYLALCELGKPDMRNTYGNHTCAVTFHVSGTNGNLPYHGIYDLYGNLNIVASGCKIKWSDRHLYLWKNDGTREYIDTGKDYNNILINNWNSFEMCTGSGNGFDFADVFIPEKHNAKYNPFDCSCAFESGADMWFTYGGHDDNRMIRDIFDSYFRCSTHYAGARLAKI